MTYFTPLYAFVILVTMKNSLLLQLIMQDSFAIVASSIATFKSLFHPHFGCNGNRGLPVDRVLAGNQWGLLKYMAKMLKASFLKLYPTYK